MGDIAVDVFLKTLKQLITSSKLILIISEKNQLQFLEEEIKYLREFLKVTEKKRNDHSELMELVMQIRDLVSEAESIVELFVVHAFKVDELASAFEVDEACWPSSSQETEIKYLYLDPLSLDLGDVKKGLKTLMTKVKKIYDENIFDISGVAVKQLKHSSPESGGGSGSSRGSNTSRVVKEEVVVGFKEEVERLIDKLDDRGEGRPLEIISIISAGGGGKTTLAREVYYHRFTLYTFDVRVWIDVSQDYDKTRKRDLLISILESAIPNKHEDYGKFSDDQLGEDVLKCLKGRKYLIVMDDTWGIEAWNDIQRSFPKERKGSKVLFTSRQLVQLDGVGYVPHYLAPLPTNWCWELLQKKVFGMELCPPELAGIGEQIAEKCEGLPLVVIAIGGILATEEKTLDVWKKVAKHLSSIIAKNQEASCMEILELSYNHLPLHLKVCLLYIGGYPEDIEIPACELMRLWIAEGFIQPSDGGKSLETIAKDYLSGLIDRSLVQVARKSPLGGIKACRIHDLLRELCLKKAEDDNFFVKVYESDSFSPSATNKHRRLFIGHQFFQKFSSRPQNLRSLRSFLCLSSRRLLESYNSLENTNFSFFAENFELLRVLGVLSLRTATFRGQKELGDLVHLRYLAYTLKLHDALPFTYLLNLETLNIFASNGRTIQLPLDIFKMVNLRHLYTKGGVFTFHHSSERAGSIGFDCSSKLDSLQTLQRICACEVCRSLLVRTPNLRKLGLQGGTTPEGNVLSFPDIEFLNCLEKLTFTLWGFYWTKESTFPPGLKLPLTITQITLKFTGLKWEELALLQALPSLEVLKLINNACHGPVWNISELEGFPQLKYLRLFDLDIEEWNASEDQFSKLEVLEIDQCIKLEHIPIDFANLYELREIKLENCQSSAEESAKEIQEEQRNKKGDDDCLILLTNNNRFPLIRAEGSQESVPMQDASSEDEEEDDNNEEEGSEDDLLLMMMRMM